MSKVKRAINFDLDTKALKEHYPGKNWRKAYKDVGNFLKENGFKHRQWSGYVSENPLSKANILKISIELKNKFPWLSKCVNYFDVTNIGKTYDMRSYLSGEEEVYNKDVSEKQHTKQNTKPHSSLSQLIRKAKEQMKENENSKGQDIIQNNIKTYNER